MIGLETYPTRHYEENLIPACWNLLRAFHVHARDCRAMIGGDAGRGLL
jgi:hypothetical protein